MLVVFIIYEVWEIIKYYILGFEISMEIMFKGKEWEFEIDRIDIINFWMICKVCCNVVVDNNLLLDRVFEKGCEWCNFICNCGVLYEIVKVVLV